MPKKPSIGKLQKTLNEISIKNSILLRDKLKESLDEAEKSITGNKLIPLIKAHGPEKIFRAVYHYTICNILNLVLKIRIANLNSTIRELEFNIAYRKLVGYGPEGELSIVASSGKVHRKPPP